jgi:hypothetical protein
MRKTCRRRKCGTVPNFSCPSRIIIHQNLDTGKFTMTLFAEHNHDCKEEYLKFQPFPVSLRKYLIAKLSMGIDQRRILYEIRSQKWTELEDLDDIKLDKRDLANSR